jgi:hypothetical protein
VSTEDESNVVERPNAGGGLRLIKTPEPKRPEPSPELKAMLDDMRRHYRVSRERVERDPSGNDAA